MKGVTPYGGARPGPNLERTTAVGSYAPNAFGLHDMHGNVLEWCQDWLDPNYYRGGAVTDPPGPFNGTSRVWRGGAWDTEGRRCRSAYRVGNSPDTRSPNAGFRVVCVKAER